MEVKNKSVRLMIVGDVNLGDHPVCLGHGVKSMQLKFGPNFPFLKVKEVLSKADITMGNLEVVLSEKGIDYRFLNTVEFRSYPDAVKGLQYAGYDIVSVATNHALNHGEEPFRDSLNILSENGIKYVGLKSVSGGCVPVVIEAGGVKVGFLAYSLRPEKYFKGLPCYADGKTEVICEDIKALKQECSFIVVSLHWGDEFIQRPSLWQIESARALIHAGAGIIIGHHPHVLQGMEHYKGGFIAYSLGNFVCDMWQKERRETVIIDLLLNDKDIESVNLIPVKINNMLQPEILGGEEAEKLIKKLKLFNSFIHSEDFARRSEKEEKYWKEVFKTVRKNRYQSYLYFLKNIFRYKPRFAYQNIMRSVLRRI